jgi:hypothetical protein
MKMFVHGLGFLLRILVVRATAPRVVFTTLATMSFAFCGAALVTAWWQPVAENMATPFISARPSVDLPWAVASFFLILTLLFSLLSYRFRGKSDVEPLVQTPILSDPLPVGRSTVACFCGSIERLHPIDIIVTSENREITLGSISGTSVSGRVRRMAATRDANGNILTDPLHAAVQAWKAAQPNLGPFELGTTIPLPVGGALASISTGTLASITTHLVLAVGLEKHDDGRNVISETANRRIVCSVLDYAEQNGCTSIYMPVFGLGSGGLPPREAIEAVLSPLMAELSARQQRFDILVGTYRVSQAALTISTLLRRS